MNFLICEKCGGYYHLNKGESIKDFLSCECGGKLYLLEYGDDGEFQSPRIICESCGNLNTIHKPFCSNCGQILRHNEQIVTTEKNLTFKIGFFAGIILIIVFFTALVLFS